MAKNKPAAIVAELGRPETPAETAARKANDSYLYKKRKTVNNLVLSLLVSLGLVLVMALAVPRGIDTWSAHTVDVSAAAQGASVADGRQFVAPAVPDSWKAKQAELRTAPSGDITYWYIGYTTESEAYAAVEQAFTESGAPVDATWISQQLDTLKPTGTETIGTILWTVYDYPERSADETNVRFALEGSVGDTTLLVYGTDSSAAIRTLAASVADEILKDAS